jgi:type IV secretion system protein TrbL
VAGGDGRGWVMFDWLIGGLGTLFGYLGDAVGDAVGWAWDKVIQGIYRWLANGLALLIEWVWSVLDSATTPHVTAGWFRNELAARVGAIALAVTVAMMLASAIQAALAGRPEQIGDAVKEGIRAVVASALTLTVIDVLIRVVDETSGLVWQVGRQDLVTMIEGMVVVATTTGALGATFIGPLCLVFGFIGLIGLVVSLMMRSALIYVAAALAPIVWSTNVLPLFRGSARKLVHLTVSLIVSKLAIVITLVVAVKLIAHPAGDPSSGSVINDAAAAVGTLMSGFVCFLIAAVTPMILYKIMPTVEGAMVASGVAGGWGRSATTAAHTALMVKSFGASMGATAATRSVAGQGGVAGQSGGAGLGSATSAGSAAGSRVASTPVTGLSGGTPSSGVASTATTPAGVTGQSSAGTSTPQRPSTRPGQARPTPGAARAGGPRRDSTDETSADGDGGGS